VPGEERGGGGRLRKSMFPPETYVVSKEEVASISVRLKRCRRLLPVHDDGGCFFIAVLRRRETSQAPLRRGDRVVVKSQAKPATVRGPGTGRFAGLMRIAYADGSTYHAAVDDLERPSGTQASTDQQQDGGAVGSPKTDAVLQAEQRCKQQVRHEQAVMSPVSQADWQDVSSFYGLTDDCQAAAAAGIAPFPRGALVYGPDPRFDGNGTPGQALCLASPSIRALGAVPAARPVARAVFISSNNIEFTADAEGGNSESSKVGWHPTAEVLRSLRRYCGRRVARASAAVMQQLMDHVELPCDVVGADATWASGAIIVVDAEEDQHVKDVKQTEEDAILNTVLLASLINGRVRVVFEKGFNYRPALSQDSVR